jgi:hypothetical protein
MKRVKSLLLFAEGRKNPLNISPNSGYNHIPPAPPYHVLCPHYFILSVIVYPIPSLALPSVASRSDLKGRRKMFIDHG